MTDRLSPQRESEIRERAEAATPGPWTVEADRQRLHRYVLDADGLVYIDFGYVGNRTQDDAEFTAHARADVPALLAELAAVRAERDELQARSRRLIEQWNKRAETWAPLSSPEKNPETFDHYRALCSAYCETADNLHNVLNGLDPDVPWHLRKSEETTS
jgi:hypothetical protein